MHDSPDSNMQRRQNGPTITEDDIYFDDDGWYSDKTYIIKWSIVGGIFLLFAASLLIAYFHAQSRIKKGLRPMAYHSWLVSRRQKMPFHPAYQNQHTAYPRNTGEQDGYAMNGYALSPPVYDRTNAPVYLPPDGASKANPDQHDYAAIPPPGAPPTRNDAPTYPTTVAGSSTRD